MNDTTRSVSQLVPESSVEQPRQAPLIQPEPPPVIPQAATPPQTSKPPFVPKKTILIIIGIIVAMCIVVGILYTRLTANQSDGNAPTPIPTTVVTPTPVQSLSAISTTSAFMEYHNAVASFSATLTSFDMQDRGLTPPMLELELGLSP